jgi:hypothetical protein
MELLKRSMRFDKWNGIMWMGGFFCCEWGFWAVFVYAILRGVFRLSSGSVGEGDRDSANGENADKPIFGRGGHSSKHYAVNRGSCGSASHIATYGELRHFYGMGISVRSDVNTVNPLRTTAILPLSKYLVPSKEVHARLGQVNVPGLGERKETTAFCYPEL